MGIDADLLQSVGVFSFAGLLYLVMALAAGVHVVLNKRNEASALTWLGIIVLSPYFGVLVYWLFGINRIQRRAAAALSGRTTRRVFGRSLGDAVIARRSELRWRSLMRLGRAVHDAAYVEGNILRPLDNGNEAYPAMLEAIAGARETVLLSSYIFEYDTVGRRFVDALVAAQHRGVAVRVLIDGIGVGYGLSLVRADRVLRKRGVSTARFLSTFSTNGSRFINLRNHRKILSVDGRVAFIGGINIRDSNIVGESGRRGTRDVHFEVRGPVIDQIQAVFIDDWEFAAGEVLHPPAWDDREPGPKPLSDDVEHPGVVSRVLLDGPDDNYQKLQFMLVAACNAARRRIRILTPYFLPDRTIVHALQQAALRGVRVEIIIPSKNNLPFVDWAMQANEQRLLEYGIRLFRTPPPFDHGKLCLVDDEWCLVGSSNWDTRSLELNFEINLECYDERFNAEIDAIIERRLEGAREIEQGAPRVLPIRLRNNFFRLFSPYL